MAELAPHHARDVARTAMGYSQAFDGRNIDWHSDEPWPHRIELAQALDWITELGAMVLNLADRVEKAEGPNGMVSCPPWAGQLDLELGHTCRKEDAMEDDRAKQAEDLLRRCLDGFGAYIHGRKLKRQQRDRLREDLEQFLEGRRVRTPQPERDVPAADRSDWS